MSLLAAEPVIVAPQQTSLPVRADADDSAFDAKCADVCEVYHAAAGADDSHRTVSIDEMTGIQALERAAPGLPMSG